MELVKAARVHFFNVYFAWRKFLNIYVLSQYILYWINFQNIYTFTYQNTSKSLRCVLNSFAVSSSNAFIKEFLQIVGSHHLSNLFNLYYVNWTSIFILLLKKAFRSAFCCRFRFNILKWYFSAKISKIAKSPLPPPFPPPSTMNRSRIRPGNFQALEGAQQEQKQSKVKVYNSNSRSLKI